MCTMEEVDEIGRRANSIPISCSLKLNMDGLLERIWEMMALVSVWSPTGCPPPLCCVQERNSVWIGDRVFCSNTCWEGTVPCHCLGMPQAHHTLAEHPWDCRCDLLLVLAELRFEGVLDRQPMEA
jgi:hypothetical protein